MLASHLNSYLHPTIVIRSAAKRQDFGQEIGGDGRDKWFPDKSSVKREGGAQSTTPRVNHVT